MDGQKREAAQKEPKHRIMEGSLKGATSTSSVFNCLSAIKAC